MPIAVGSFVNFAGTYSVGLVTQLVTPGADPLWEVVVYGGFYPLPYRVPESQLWELLFTIPPAGFANGDLVEVVDDGRFWFFPAGPSVPIGRGVLLFALTAGPGAVPVAWVQLERGAPAVIALWESLTIVRKFGAGIP